MVYWNGFVGLVAANLVVVIFCAQQQQVYATNFFERLGNAIDGIVDDSRQGYNDGKEAAEQNYPNGYPGCPYSSDSDKDSYCAGYFTGYLRGWDAMDAIGGNNNNDNGGGDNNDDN